MSVCVYEIALFVHCLSSHLLYLVVCHTSRRYKESEIIHAKHDADLLGVKGTIADVNLNYCQKNLSQKVLVRLQAGAFLSLCKHLRERSDAVQNIELMTIGGFCRNCLAKVSDTLCT
jgi:hypothetical protein